MRRERGGEREREREKREREEREMSIKQVAYFLAACTA